MGCVACEAVAERKRQVPYRNHKLTQLLQDDSHELNAGGKRLKRMVYFMIFGDSRA